MVMNKNLIPTYMAKTIFNIRPEKLKKEGISHLFVDLDNTLASPYIDLPDDQVKKWIEEVKKSNIAITILSNNHEERVKKFAESLQVSYLSDVKKPRIFKLKNYLKEKEMDYEKCMAIGDQIMTDVLLAKKLNLKVILVEPRTSKDEPITFFPRLLDKYFRKKIKKKNLAGYYDYG